jgi:hypothetical protein
MATGYTLVYYGNTTVNKSISVPDGESATVGNVIFPGRNFSGYGSPVDQNFLSLLENFASQTNQPTNPVVGQFWMDAANSEMCYNGATTNDDDSAASWRSLLYRQIDFSNAANTITTLAKVGNVVVGNIANTDPNNRIIKFDANGSGNISTTGNIIVGDNGDGSIPVHGNLTLNDNGNIETYGDITIGKWYDTAGNSHSATTLYPNGSSITTSTSACTQPATFSLQTIVDPTPTTVSDSVTLGSNGYISATGVVELATRANVNANAKVIIGTAGNIVSRDVLEVWGDVKYHGNFEIYGDIAAINSQSMTVKDAVADIGALENNAPLYLNDGLDRGLAFHTYAGAGIQATLTAAVAANDTTFTVSTADAVLILGVVNTVITAKGGSAVTSPATGLAQHLVRVGYTEDNCLGLDVFVDTINTTTGVIGLNTGSKFTAIVASGKKLNIGKDNIHFMGWDATDNTGGGEFIFTTKTLEISATNNYFSGNTISGPGVSAISGNTANVHAAEGKFDGNVYVGYSGTAGVTVMPNSNVSLDLGNSVRVWKNGYFSTISDNATLTSSGTVYYGSAQYLKNITFTNAGIGNALWNWLQNPKFDGTLGDPGTGTSYSTLGDLKTTSLTSGTLTATGTTTTTTLVATTGTVTSLSGSGINYTTATVGTGGLTVNGLTTASGGLNTTSITTGGASVGGTITGAWTLSGSSTLEATYADLAERHHADAEYATGTVMAVGGINEVTAAQNGNRVLGVVSDKYAYLMNREAGPQETHPAVAYVGRVPVRVVGPIKKHQRIAALKDGTACASEDNSFGWAIETNEEPGEKLVMCIIK